MLPDAVLWDMDGTIIDTEPIWQESQVVLTARYGAEWTHQDGLSLVGSGLERSGEILRDKGVDMEVEEIVQWMTDYVVERLHGDDLPWRPGARELVEELHDRGIPTALVTMSRRTMALVTAEAFGARGFRVVVAGDDVDRPKPHPDAYLAAAAQLGVEPTACIAIEDSATGVASARASGAVTVAVEHIVPIAEGAGDVHLTTLSGRRRRPPARTHRSGAHRACRRTPGRPGLRPDVGPRHRRGRAMSDDTTTTPDAGAHDTGAHDAGAPDATVSAAEVELPHTAGGAPHTPPRGPFRAGDRVQLTGPKGKLTTLSLEPGVVYHTHRGMLAHDDVIGQPDGSVIRASTGDEYLALRPLLNDYVMSMPRGAAIVYPKDAAQIVAFADVFPGARVVEAGVGSGALSLWLLRAIGPTGSLQSFERREEFAAIARGNVGTFLGAVPDNWSVTVGDLVEELPEAVEPQSIDRVVLDMLAPWECVDEAADALAPGGLIVCYVATVTQLSRTAEALRDTGRFTDPQSSETLVRTWHVEGLAVRPDHRMVAHTGFLITARRLADGVVLPNLKRRAGKAEFSDEDVEAWTPGAVGERGASDKKLRKVARQAAAQARKVAAAEAASAASDPSDGDR